MLPRLLPRPSKQHRLTHQHHHHQASPPGKLGANWGPIGGQMSTPAAVWGLDGRARAEGSSFSLLSRQSRRGGILFPHPAATDTYDAIDGITLSQARDSPLRVAHGWVVPRREMRRA
eukprot:363984-Chlamydomonas_euryale.AAC.22